MIWKREKGHDVTREEAAQRLADAHTAGPAPAPADAEAAATPS